MNLLVPVALFVAGLVLMIIEVFIPSFGVLTIGSVACLIGALYLGFVESSTLGWSLVGASIVGIPTLLILSFKLFPRTSLGRHMMLDRPEKHPEPVTRSDRQELVGRTGITLSPLRPSGIAELEGERIDVVTRGEMLDSGVAVRVIENRGNRIVVRQAEPAATEPKEL